jgi:hypothetical protein
MVHAFSGNPDSTLAGACPTVTLYSNFTTGIYMQESVSDDTFTPRESQLLSCLIAPFPLYTESSYASL